MSKISPAFFALLIQIVCIGTMLELTTSERLPDLSDELTRLEQEIIVALREIYSPRPYNSFIKLVNYLPPS